MLFLAHFYIHVGAYTCITVLVLYKQFLSDLDISLLYVYYMTHDNFQDPLAHIKLLLNHLLFHHLVE